MRYTAQQYVDEALRAMRCDDYSSACSYFEKAIQQATRSHDDEVLACALDGMSLAVRHSCPANVDPWQHSKLLIDEALAIYRRIGSVRGVGRCLRIRAPLLNNSAMALRSLTKSVRLLEACGAAIELAESLRALGIALEQAGRTDEAKSTLLNAIRTARSANSDEALAAALEAAAITGAFDGICTRSFFDEAQSLYRGSGQRRRLAEVLVLEATSCDMEASKKRSKVLEARALFVEVGMNNRVAICDRLLGSVS